jgi:hypothetical protein
LRLWRRIFQTPSVSSRFVAASTHTHAHEHALTTQEREETIVGLGEKITGLKKIEFYLKWKIGQLEQQFEPGEKDIADKKVCGGGGVVVVSVV